MSACCTGCGWTGSPADADRHLCRPGRTHGVSGTYDRGCRCRPCTDARVRYQKQWLYERAQGRRRWVDAAPVAAHVRRLLAAGMTLSGIARAAGVSKQTVTRPVRGETTQMQAAKAAAILAVTGPAYAPEDETFVDRHGTVLRIRALMALGWRHEDMHADSGVRTMLVLAQPGRLITWRNAQRVRAMYDRLAMTPGPSAVTRRRALAAGHVPPLGLDESRIDDPAYVPDPGVRYRQSARGVPREDVLELLAQGQTHAAIAARLGISEAAVDRARYGRGPTNQRQEAS